MESSRFHSYLKNRILDLPYCDACTWSIRRAVLGYMDCQNIFIYLFIYLFIGPWDYHIGPNFWKFYLIRTGFTLGEPVSLVKVFRLFRLERIVLVL